MFYSYVMGIDDSILELVKQGFIVESDGDNYQVSFPKEMAQVWEAFIMQHLEVEFWNEYLTDSKVIFIFHLADGFKRYEVENFINEEVLSLCEKLCECKFQSIKQMLSDNAFYGKILK